MMRRAAALVLLVAAARGQGEAQEVRELVAELRSPDSSTRSRAAAELGELGSAARSAVPALVKRLGDEDTWVRDRAREAIGKIGPEGLPAVMKAIDAPDANVRAGVARVLEESFVPYLTAAHLRDVAALLRDKDDAARQHAARALGKRGDAAIELLSEAFAGSDPRARAAAAIGFVTMGAPATPALVAALGAPAEDVRSAAARALGEIRAAGAGEALLAALADPSPSVAGDAAAALGRTGAIAEKGVPRLVEGLRSGDRFVREGSVEGLAAYGEAAAAAVVAALGDDLTRAAASDALRRMGATGLAACRGALGDGSAAMRRAALETIASFDLALMTRETADAAIERLLDPEPPVRAAAARALAVLGPLARTERLRAASRDEDPSVRAAAFLALGELAVDPLAVDEKDPLVRVEALIAVAKTRRGAGVEEIARIAADPAADMRLRIAAVDGLGTLGIGARGIDLVGLLAEADARLRRAAASALARTTLPVADAIRESRAAAKPDRAVGPGLAWLAHAQREGGEWESGDATTGVTGLALLAFLAAGQAPGDLGHGHAVAKAVNAILASQQANGLLGRAGHHAHMVCHGIASIALVEAYMMSGDYRCRRAAQLALDHIARARNPYLAWRYEPRGGENDTHVTTWMVMALRLGDAAGLRVDPEAYQGAALWIDKMTHPGTGRIGYNYPGGPPARPDGLRDEFPPEEVETMTAAGLWCRTLLGIEALHAADHRRGVDLVRSAAPRWSKGTEDYLYYHFGALALFQEGDAPYRKWEKPLLAALASSRDEGNGSWRPKDVWSGSVGAGAPVYATALGVLTLLTPSRYPRDFLTKPRATAATQAAIAALRKAQADEDPEVRAIAAAACARLGS